MFNLQYSIMGAHVYILCLKIMYEPHTMKCRESLKNVKGVKKCNTVLGMKLVHIICKALKQIIVHSNVILYYHAKHHYWQKIRVKMTIFMSVSKLHYFINHNCFL